MKTLASMMMTINKGGGDIINREKIERRFSEIDAYLKALTDTEPHAAIKAARMLNSDDVLNQYNIDALAAGTLIDAGVAAGDFVAVDEGVVILERLVSPERDDIQYCLANGLSSKADFNATAYPEWYLSTADIRQRARRLYQTACSNRLTPLNISSQSYTNLGNSLLRAYRLVEAYDCYTRALKNDPTNSIALTGAARVLIRLAAGGVGDSQVLLSVASKYLRKAKEKPDRIRQLAGEQAYQNLLKFLDTDVPAGELPDLSSANDYQKFVAKHRLSLAPTIEGLDLTISRWDSLHIHSITEKSTQSNITVFIHTDGSAPVISSSPVPL